MTAADGAPDVSIGHLAPRRQFRGVYPLPPDQVEGVLVLQVISRFVPDHRARQLEQPLVPGLSGSGKKEDNESKHCRMRFSQLTDSAQVSSFLSNGDPQEDRPDRAHFARTRTAQRHPIPIDSTGATEIRRHEHREGLGAEGRRDE